MRERERDGESRGFSLFFASVVAVVVVRVEREREKKTYFFSEKKNEISKTGSSTPWTAAATALSRTPRLLPPGEAEEAARRGPLRAAGCAARTCGGVSAFREIIRFFFFFGSRGLATTATKKKKLKTRKNVFLPFFSPFNYKTGRLLAALRALDAEDDVNRVTAYFSYEHFYVIYCKFWVRRRRFFYLFAFLNFFFLSFFFSNCSKLKKKKNRSSMPTTTSCCRKRTSSATATTA